MTSVRNFKTLFEETSLLLSQQQFNIVIIVRTSSAVIFALTLVDDNKASEVWSSEFYLEIMVAHHVSPTTNR